MMGQFLNGLKEDVKTEVRVLNPMSLEQAMELALRVEDKNKATWMAEIWFWIDEDWFVYVLNQKFNSNREPNFWKPI